MLHELVNAVVQLPQAVAVGYLPSGTVNDFAATHSLPRDPVKAAEVAVSDHILSLDVGLVQRQLVFLRGSVRTVYTGLLSDESEAEK